MALDEYDVVILGAGFGAIATLIRLRKLGLKIKVYEKGGGLGGVWYWNCYPGARVDSHTPVYQLFDKELWEGWSFKQRYPSREDLREYFNYLDSKLGLKRNIQFNTACTGAMFDEQANQWVIYFDNGSEVRARWFIAAVGCAAKPYTPNYPGLDKYQGEMYHTSRWPQEGVSLKDKRIAVIGTGASGVQTIQECAPVAKHLVAYQRTPNNALPMVQLPVNLDGVERDKAQGIYYKTTFEACFKSSTGFGLGFNGKNAFDDTPEERNKVYEDLLKKGGFNLLLSGYQDLGINERANHEVYHFWRRFVHSRVKDSKKAEMLAPSEPPHPFGAKRLSLEQNYYEMFNLPHVDLIDLNSEPIVEFTETGIRTKRGLSEFDLIILATGFDSITGPLAQLDIRNTKGKTIAEHWKDGLKSAFGIALAGFPNMFYLYGPQAPTAFSNGPTCVELQARWIEKVIRGLIRKGVTRFEANPEKEVEWTKLTHELWYATLHHRTKGWYQGSNIPGKREEPLNFIGGIPLYSRKLFNSIENNYQDWIVAY